MPTSVHRPFLAGSPRSRRSPPKRARALCRSPTGAAAALLALLLTHAAAHAAAAAPDDFERCKARLMDEARAAGIDAAVARQVLAGVSYSPRVIELDRRQPEFTSSFGQYFHTRVTEERIAAGRRLLEEHRPLLAAVQRETGVPPHYLVSFWGLETNFGSYFGKMSVPDSLTTLACDPRRSRYFTGELFAALRIVEAGDIAAERMEGSWAGAMGHVQFMPSTFLRYAVDADGDGRRDLWGSLPDALHSAGRFLAGIGWQPGLRWGREVLLPPDFDYALANGDAPRPLAQWRRLGITDAFGRPLPALDLQARLIVPAGHEGPAFVVYGNFDVIMGWNRSEFYALTVGHLADRIAGAGRLRQPPPESAERIALTEVKTLQAQLNALGFDAGNPDGVPGPATRRALSRFQRAQGAVPDGHLDPAVMEAVAAAAEAKAGES